MMQSRRYRATSVGIAAAVLLAWSVHPVAAIPDRVEGSAKASELPTGGEVESAVGVAEGGNAGPGADNPGGTTSSHGLVTRYWRGPMPPDGYDCAAAGATTPDNTVYEFVEHDRRTDPPTITVLLYDCIGPDDPVPVSSSPPPPPPTLEEMSDLAREQILVPEVHVNPEWGGVTGLESWFWYEGPEEIEAAVTIRGFAVTAMMRPTRFYWDPCAAYRPPDSRRGAPRGCPALLESSSPGSRPDSAGDGREAAAHFLYETAGTYEIRHQVVWEGTWSFTGPDGEIASGSLPTIRATGARPDYVVEEVRSELRDVR